MNCKDCKFWTRLVRYMHETSGDLSEFQVLETDIKYDMKFGNCLNTNFIDISSKYMYDRQYIALNDRPNTLLYSDHDSYKAKFVTGEDFGCIHFTPKE